VPCQAELVEDCFSRKSTIFFAECPSPNGFGIFSKFGGDFNNLIALVTISFVLVPVRIENPT